MRSTDIYVVGGVVDRNRYKNLTLEQAAAQASPAPRAPRWAATALGPLPARDGGAPAQGIRSAKLPIGAHLAMLGSPVLTVNQARRAACALAEPLSPPQRRGGGPRRWQSADVALTRRLAALTWQVMDILLAYLELRDWGAACLKAVPQRKHEGGDKADKADKKRKAPPQAGRGGGGQRGGAGEEGGASPLPPFSLSSEEEEVASTEEEELEER